MQAQGMLSTDIVFANRAEFVPKIEHAGDDDSDAEADREKDAIGGQPNQSDGNDQGCGDQSGRASNWNSH